MTTKIAGIVIDIDARLTKLESSFAKATRDMGKFKSDTLRAANDIEGGFNKVGRSFDAAAKETRNLRIAGIGAGQQMQDMAIQFQSGTRASTIMAQQLPQLALAMSYVRDSSNKTLASVGKFGTFLAGPWGLIVPAAAILLGPLIDNIFSTGKEAEKAKPKIDTLASAIERLNNATGRIDLSGTFSQVLSKKLEADAKIARIDETLGSENRLGRAGQQARKRLQDQRDVLAQQSKDAQDLLDVTKEGFETQKKLDEIKSRREKDTNGGTSKAQRDEERINNAYDQALQTSRDQFRVDELRLSGRDHEADLLQSELGILRQFPTLDRARLGVLYDQQKAVIDQRKAASDQRKAWEDLHAWIKATTPDEGQFFDRINAERSKSMQSELIKSMKDMGILMPSVEKMISGNTQKIEESWDRMADSILSSMNRVQAGINGGGFLSTLQGVFDLFLSIGSTGLFGQKLATNIKGARASGGPVSGGSTYLVGENGPELFTAPSSGTIVPNSRLMAANDHVSGAGGGGVVHIVPSPYFDAVVDGRSARVATPIAAGAALAGAGIAQQRIARAGRNRIP